MRNLNFHRQWRAAALSLLLAAATLPPAMQLSPYHAHDGVVHTHAQGGIAHSHHGFDAAFAAAHPPHAQDKFFAAANGAGGIGEHQRLSAEEIRARMVRPGAGPPRQAHDAGIPKPAERPFAPHAPPQRPEHDTSYASLGTHALLPAPDLPAPLRVEFDAPASAAPDRCTAARYASPAKPRAPPAHA